MNTHIHYDVGSTTLGKVLVAMSDKGICAILLGDSTRDLMRDLRERFPRAQLVQDEAKLAHALPRVAGFVESPDGQLDLPLDPAGTEFQRRVWRALRRIPAGSTASYTDIARRIEAPKSFRAVAQACGANPIALAIPCHRVVRSDGALSGYRWGIARKRALLDREAGVPRGATMSALPALVLAAGAPATAAARLAAADWPRIAAELDERGTALLQGLLDRETCRAIAASYADTALFRSRVVMSKHGFGRGEYRYFAYPLPFDLTSLRAALYAQLAPLANRWNERLAIAARFPLAHAEFLARCHAAGQARPTPLLLRYGAGDYNCLHRDLYGEHVFPLQMAVLLSAPGTDFTGGEFVVTEQRPRMQSRVEVVPLSQGDAVIFAVSERPVQGTRGAYRVTHRHGVSRVTRGERHTLGVILHDAT